MGLRRIKNTRGQSNTKSRSPFSKLTFENLEARQLLTTTVFQQGVGGYSGQEDTVLYSRDPDVNFGTEGSISPDQQDSNGVRQGLLQFNDIIGSSAIRFRSAPASTQRHWSLTS